MSIVSALIFALAITTAIKFNAAEQNSIGEHYEAKEVANKNPRELIRLRGFKSENHYFKTVDGYLVNLVRIVNPHVKKSDLKRPVLFNHGLYESATIWLINSKDIRARPYKQSCTKSGEYIRSVPRDDDNALRNNPMYLANHAYDVWLMSMRGTIFSRRHVSLNSTDPKFWDYSLDDFGLKDVPGAIDYIRKQTKAKKVGYVGHSQATFSVFALLATKRKYNKIIEPVGAVAPVSFFDHITSILRVQVLAALKNPNPEDNAPFPPDAEKVRDGIGELCKADDRTSELAPICDFITELISGPSGKAWLSGYYSHLPFSTSKKVLRHFGFLVRDRRFKHYDYGPTKNIKVYGKSKAPDYKIGRISSESICLFYSSKDTISAPKDVERFIDGLTVPLLRDVFIHDEKINHFDLITHEDASSIISKELLDVLETFVDEQGENSCKRGNHTSKFFEH